MCNLQKHGGPDDSGLYSCKETGLVLGHRRLALIDLSAAGHQPMLYNQYVISFNGEIYNFQELRSELVSLGKIFYTNSDTEVILAAFSQWKTQSFARLSGMFAFALYDTFENILYLVRDTAGIKPLYYCSTSTSVEFASEVRGFSVLNKEENKNWPVYQLAYGHIPEPVTTMKEVKPLQKGFFFKYNCMSGVSSLQSYHHYSFSNSISNVGYIENAIRTKLQDAVKRHLIADASIGVFLSGGIDSSIITLIASKYQKHKLKTLSLYFNEHGFSEKDYQDLVIENLQCAHYQHLLTQEEFNEFFPVILQSMDMPSCDGINTWFISKYAKLHNLKAVLSGIGADEIFGGYPSFKRIGIALQLQTMPSFLLLLASKSNQKQLRRLHYLLLDGIKGLYLFLRGQFIPVDIAKQLNATEKEVWDILQEQPVFNDLSSLPAKNKASWMEINMYMQNQLLRDSDVMSMAHGVEIRVPFLDSELVRFMLSVEQKIKYSGQISKQILIEAFKDKLPEPVWNRKKMGFSFPFKKWLMDSDYVKETFNKSSSVSRSNFKQFLDGNFHWSHMMSLLILQTRGIT